MTKAGIFYIIYLYYFSRFYQTKTRPEIKNLRHSSLDRNVGYMYRKFQLSIYYNKPDIDVQKIKVENAFFVYSRPCHLYFPLSFLMIFISMYVIINWVSKYVSCILILLTAR